MGIYVLRDRVSGKYYWDEEAESPFCANLSRARLWYHPAAVHRFAACRGEEIGLGVYSLDCTGEVVEVVQVALAVGAAVDAQGEALR